MTEREFERQLQRFFRLLVKEKEYLIKGQGEKLIELVEKKKDLSQSSNLMKAI